jgi:hypothetical protein
MHTRTPVVSALHMHTCAPLPSTYGHTHTSNNDTQTPLIISPAHPYTSNYTHNRDEKKRQDDTRKAEERKAAEEAAAKKAKKKDKAKKK